MKMKALFLSCLFFLTATPSFVSAENVSLSTYYVSPYGKYDRFWLKPRAALSEPCDIGLIYSELPGVLRYCRDDGGGQGTWAAVSIWTQNSDDLYPTDTATNPNLSVGIGTESPGSRLTVKGGGNTSATNSLDILDSTNRSLFFINDAGYIGIGTNSPASPLEIKHEVDPLSTIVPPLVRFTNQAGFTEPVEFQLDAYHNAGRLLSSSGISVFLDSDDDDADSDMSARSGFEILKNSDRYQASDSADQNLMVVKQNGRVGIGQSARFPAAHLEVSASGGSAFRFMLSSDDTNGDLFIVQPNGDVGIGETSPQGDLHVGGTDAQMVIGDISNPTFPLEVKGTTSDDMTAAGWNKAIKIENTNHTGGAVVWTEIPGLTTNNFYMDGPSWSGAGNFHMGLIDELDGTTPFQYGIVFVGQSLAGKPVQGSVIFEPNLVIEGNVVVNHSSVYVPTQPLEVFGDAAVADFAYADDFCINGGGPCLSGLSDSVLKKEILPLKGSLDRLLELRGVSFEWKHPDGKRMREGRQFGFIAQEVEKVFPDWVRTNQDGYKAIYQEGIEALTVEALRELKSGFDQKIETFRTEIERLRQENQALKDALDGGLL